MVSRFDLASDYSPSALSSRDALASVGRCAAFTARHAWASVTDRDASLSDARLPVRQKGVAGASSSVTCSSVASIAFGMPAVFEHGRNAVSLMTGRRRRRQRRFL